MKKIDYRGRVYDRFHARRSPDTGPGWYVYGRNVDYGDTLVMLCAWPDVPERKHKHYNGKVLRGWNTKREAEAVASRMNATAGLCPICGARVRLTGATVDGRLIGSCGDAFTLRQWAAPEDGDDA